MVRGALCSETIRDAWKRIVNGKGSVLSVREAAAGSLFEKQTI